MSGYTETVSFFSATLTVTPLTSNAAVQVSVNDLADSSGIVTAPGLLAVGNNLIRFENDRDDGVSAGSNSRRVARQTENKLARHAHIEANNGSIGDQFSYTLPLSGDTLAVGGYRGDCSPTGVDGNQANNTLPDSGAVYLYYRNAAVWIHPTCIKRSGTDNGDFLVTARRFPVMCSAWEHRGKMATSPGLIAPPSISGRQLPGTVPWGCVARWARA